MIRLEQNSGPCSNQEQKNDNPVSQPGVKCWGKRARQVAVQYALGIQRQFRDSAAISVNDTGNSRVGDTHKGQSFFDGAQAGSSKVLIWPGTDAVPAIVG